jgi:hypothetical protein
MIAVGKVGTALIICFDDGTILRFHNFRKIWILAKSQVKKCGYKCITIDKKTYLIHRILGFAFGKINNIYSPFQIDHIDRNKLNNNISNLRAVTPSQNQFNRNGKGYTLEEGRWRVKIQSHKKRLNIGCFKTEEEARQAYQDAKAIHHVIFDVS